MIAENVGDSGAELVPPVELLVVESVDVSVVERHGLVEHDEEHHAQGPHVGDAGVVVVPAQDLGRGVRQRAAVGAAQDLPAPGILLEFNRQTPI